jgi:hypothetical protein
MRRGVGYAGLTAVTTLVVAGVAVAVGRHGAGPKRSTSAAASSAIPQKSDAQ